MTRTRKALVVAAISVGVLSGGALPAMADSHVPITPDSVTALATHRPVTSQSSHIPLILQSVSSTLSPLDSHVP